MSAVTTNTTNAAAKKVSQERGRKPVDLIAASANGKLSGRDAIWAEIRKQRELFTLRSLRQALDPHQGNNPGSIDSYLTGLLAGGYIAVIERRDVAAQHASGLRAGTQERVFKLLKDAGVDAPRVRKDGTPVTQGRKRENLWRSMRIIGEFNYRELATAATTEEHRINERDAQDYVIHLHKAGYLLQTHNAQTAKQLARYRLIPSKYTGPKPPQVQSIKQVFDPNLGQVVWPLPVDPTTHTEAVDHE